MNRSIVMWVLFSGCASQSHGTAVDGSTQDQALHDLERETGFKWTVRYQADVGTPSFLDGQTTPLAATIPDAERSARAFILNHSALFKIDPQEDTFATSNAVIDEFGMMHIRLQQKKSTVPIWQAEAIIHFAADGSIRTVTAHVLSIDHLSLITAITSEESSVHAVNDVRLWRPDIDASALETKTPSLWIFPVSPGQAKLAFRVEMAINDGTNPMIVETFVDAQTGDIVHRENLLDSLEGRGVGPLGDAHTLAITERNGSFWLEDGSRGNPPQKTYDAKSGAQLPGTEIKSIDPTSWDEAGLGAGVDAHAFVAASYDYFAHVHSLAGWDGKGKGVHASVHFGTQFSGAFFNGNQLAFGDGDGQNISPLAASLDVVAHEFTHGVIANSAGLGHEGEPGALNEAIADVFGCFIAYGQGTQADWQIGEAIYHPNGQRKAMRDLAEPSATGNPSLYQEYQFTQDDQGGVHLNSTIASHAAYLMTEGGDRIGGIGSSAAERIWYRALSRYLVAHSLFSDAADATFVSARDFGEGHETTVRQAWESVGVMMAQP